MRNATEIAAVPGIDVLLFGSSDLTTELGIPGQMGHQKLIDAYQAVGDACRQHGKILGMGGISDNADAARYIAMGARFVLTGSDHNYVIDGASAKAKFMRAQAQSVTFRANSDEEDVLSIRGGPVIRCRAATPRGVVRGGRLSNGLRAIRGIEQRLLTPEQLEAKYDAKACPLRPVTVLNSCAHPTGAGPCPV